MKTLEELGFEEIKGVHTLVCERIIGTFTHNNEIVTYKQKVTFDLISRRYIVRLINMDSCGLNVLDVELHQAIHLKLKELGWIQ